VYRSLFHSAPTAILVTDAASHEILEANPRFLDLFGYSNADLKAMQLGELFVDSNFRVDLNTQDLSAIYNNNRAEITSDIAGEKSKDFVSYAKHKNGNKFLARFKCVKVDQRPELQLIYINRADGFIQSLHWRSIVENLPSIALLLKRNGEIIYANQVYDSFNIEKLIGSSAFRYLPLRAQENFLEKLRCVFDLSQTVSFESEIYAPEQIRVFQIDISPITNEQSQQIDFALVIARDVTEVVASRQEKQELDNAFTKLQHVAHIGSWSWEPVGNKIHWSNEMHQIYGVEKNDFKGHFQQILNETIHPDDRRQLENLVARIQTPSKGEWSFSCRIFRRNDGKLRYLWGGGENLIDITSGHQKSIGFVQDITDSKIMQRGLSAIASCSAEGGGMALIHELLSCYSRSTGIDIVYIATICPDQSSLSTILYLDCGEIKDNFTYPLNNTPCQLLFEKRDYYVSGDVQHRFPHDQFLPNAGIKSYVGTSLRDINNKVFAILVALHRDVLEYPDIDKTLLQITATRVASELSRMRTQQELENSEMHFRSAITSAEIVTWEWNLESNTLTWSDNVNALLEQAPSDFTAYQELVHHDDIAQVLHSIDTSLKQGRALDIDHRIIVGNNREKWLRMKGRFIESNDDNVNKFMGVILDVTPEKHALIENRQIHSRLNMHIQQTPLGVIEMDRNCNVVEWNPAAEKIFGYTKREVLGKFAIDLIVPQKIKVSVSDIWNSLVTNTGGKRAIHENLTKSGKLIICNWYNTPLVNDKGEVVAVACIVEDITHRIKIEQELESHREHLEDLVNRRTHEITRINRELQAFSYSISHDLRAPLRAIDGFSQILIEDYAKILDDTAKSYLNRVRKGAQNMATLIDDLLKLSRISRGQVNKKMLDLSDVANEVVEKLSQDYPHRIVETKIEKNLTAYADRGLIQVALENLLGNAWKYSSVHPNALVEFKKVRQDSKETVYVVSDNGVGFDMKFVDKLFGAFQRLHEKDKQFEGSGIGLATVQRIIRLHGGRVWAEGKVNQGAMFYFSLPLLVSNNEPVENNIQLFQSN